MGNPNSKDPSIGHFLQADTVVPGQYNPLAYDRYGYAFYNPINNVDPSGNICVDDGKRNICSDDTDDEQYYWPPPSFPPLPSQSDVDSREKTVSEQMRIDTINGYRELREDLYFEFGWNYIDARGKIRDEALIALILTGELSIFNFESVTYKEGLEALGNQFYDEDFSGSSYCNSGGCDIKQQLSWLFTMQFIRTEGQSNSVRNFQEHLDYAKLAKSGYSYGSDESWFWGNTTMERINAPENLGLVVNQVLTNSYPGKPWFIIHKQGFAK